MHRESAVEVVLPLLVLACTRSARSPEPCGTSRVDVVFQDEPIAGRGHQTGEPFPHTVDALAKEVVREETGSTKVYCAIISRMQGTGGVQAWSLSARSSGDILVDSASTVGTAADGWMKALTRFQTARRGSTEEWSSDDLEAARILSNETPRAPIGRAPEELWREREAITPEARGALEDQVAKEIAALRAEQGLGGVFFGAGSDEIEREAITRALGALGILSIKERRVTPTLKRLKAANIS